MFNQLINYLNLSWVGVVITLITFILAIFLTVFLYFKGKQRKGLNYHFKNDLLIDRANTQKPDQIEILFLGKKVDKLYKTLIYIWNSGDQTIKKEELNTKDPLRLRIKNESEILSIKIIKVTRSVTDFSTINSKENTEYKINFDYLDQGDGAVIEVLHNGVIDDLELLGTIMGISKIKNIDSKKENKISKILNEIFILNSTFLLNPPRLFGIFILIFGLILAFCAFYLYLNPKTTITPAIPDTLGVLIGAIIYIVFGLITILSNKRQYPKSLEIKEELHQKNIQTSPSEG